jgi:23S rRNA pseudouridine2457 synthase
MNIQVPHYFIIYKPYMVLSQFSLPQTPSGKGFDKKTLKDYFHVPNDIYSIGRLDYDSEGLLILSNDKELNHRLLNPAFAHEREYWVQVEGIVSDLSLTQIRRGVEINIDGKPYWTKKAVAEIMDPSPQVVGRNPPIRFRKNIPDSWIRMVLTEGKNRQVRKMTAKVGNPTLRLIRHRIGNLNVEGLAPGEMRELGRDEIYSALFDEK